MISGVPFESNNNVTMSKKKLERICCHSSGSTIAGRKQKQVNLRTRI